jgi:HIV Tat-specific factor 1
LSLLITFPLITGIRKLAVWDDEDGFGPSKDPEEMPESALATSRVVVLKHMFTLQELKEDPTLLLDLKEDVREECEALGEVTNVVLYDVRSFHSQTFVLSSLIIS